MKNYFVIISILAFVYIISCSPAQKESSPEAIQQLKQVQQAIISADTTTAVTAIPEKTVDSQSVPVSAAATPPELNPPHGQPFHRCDIPVGSPLNSAAPAKAATTTSNQAVAAKDAATPPELNPPHGQPFHRCDIPVGSPLKSAPQKASTPAAPAQVFNRTGMAPTIENAARLNNPQPVNSPASTAANTNSVKPKLNPPHGQPFHRCDIAVGSPLP